MTRTHSCSFFQAGAGNGDISHGHVIDGLLCFWDAALLLQAVQHHQGAHDSAAKLHGTGKESFPRVQRNPLKNFGFTNKPSCSAEML